MLLPDSREMEKQTPRWQTWGGLGDSFFGNGEGRMGKVDLGRKNKSEALHSALTTTISNH